MHVHCKKCRVVLTHLSSQFLLVLFFETETTTEGLKQPNFCGVHSELLCISKVVHAQFSLSHFHFHRRNSLFTCNTPLCPQTFHHTSTLNMAAGYGHSSRLILQYSGVSTHTTTPLTPHTTHHSHFTPHTTHISHHTPLTPHTTHHNGCILTINTYTILLVEC